MEDCIHRVRDCRDVADGVSVCNYGQVFLFIRGIGCGRFKKLEEITDKDRENFSPEMANEFKRFMRGESKRG